MKKLEKLINKYSAASPVDDVDNFSVLLTLEEAKRARVEGGMNVTNFEKWKQELTVDEFVRDMDGIDCEYCPAKSQCIDDGYEEESCADAMRKWAEQEANNG